MRRALVGPLVGSKCSTAHRHNSGVDIPRPGHGDRVLVGDGGPSASRLEYFPPRLEITERGSTYVLVDLGEPDEWLYLFVPDEY